MPRDSATCSCRALQQQAPPWAGSNFSLKDLAAQSSLWSGLPFPDASGQSRATSEGTFSRLRGQWVSVVKLLGSGSVEVGLCTCVCVPELCVLSHTPLLSVHSLEGDHSHGVLEMLHRVIESSRLGEISKVIDPNNARSSPNQVP